jgi:hypothetical protein
MARRWIDGRMVEVVDPNTAAVIRKLHGREEEPTCAGMVPPQPKRLRLVVTNDGEDAVVELVEDAEDAEVCEGCGRHVFTFAISAEEETWRMAECLPCLLKTADSIRPEEAR